MGDHVKIKARDPTVYRGQILKMLEKLQQPEEPPVDALSTPNGKLIHFHKAYGMRFRSEVFWPRVPISSESEFDVDIQMGAVPHELSDPKVCGYKFQAKPSQILLQTIHFADFHITDGKKIVVRPKSSAQPGAIQTLLWGWVLAALLHQRDVFPLHGSVIKSGNEAVIFCGDSGFGKSGFRKTSPALASSTHLIWGLLSINILKISNERYP